MLNHQFSRVPLKDRISTTEGDIQRRRRLGMSESNPEMKALRVFLQSLYAERNKENRPKLVNETLYPIAPHQKTPRASVPRTTVAKPYRLKAGGRTYNVQFAKDPDEVDLDQARQKYLAKDNPAALALIKSLQQEISGLGEEAPERYQGLVDRIDWVRKEGTAPMPADWRSKREMREPQVPENLFDSLGVNGIQPRPGNPAYERLRKNIYGRNETISNPLTLLVSEKSKSETERRKQRWLKDNPIRQMAIKTRFGTFSVPHRGQLDKETYAGFQYLLTKEAKRRGLLVVNTNQPDMTDASPPPTITNLMVGIVKKSLLGQIEEKASVLPHIKWTRDFGKELTDYAASDSSEEGSSSQKFIAGLVGGSLDSGTRPIENTTHDLANFVYDSDAPAWERALSGTSLISNFLPAGQSVGVGFKAAKAAEEGVKLSVKAGKFARAAATHTLKNSVPFDKIKDALEHGAVTWNLGREIYKGGGGLKDIFDEASGRLSGFRKTRAHVDEEKLGLGLDPARARYHSHLDLTVNNGLLSAVAARNLKIMHDLRAHKWSKKTNRKFSEYYAENAPRLGDRMERHAERGKVRGQVLSTRLPGGVHDTSQLHIADMNALKASPEYAKKVAEALGQVPGMKHIYKDGKDVNLMLDEYAHFMADNLVWLHDQTPEEIRKLVRQTFEGANKLATRLAVRHGLPLENVAGAMAALTAKTDWNHSVTNLERIVDAMKAGKHYAMDTAMEKWASREFSQDDFLRIQGRSFSDLTNVQDKVNWIKAYDRIHHGKGYRLVGANGRFGKFDTAKNGTIKGRIWNQNRDFIKAIESLEAPNIQKISQQLGNYPKIRNIYNNIVDPYTNYPFAATDIHFVSSSLGQPIASSDRTAKQAYGSVSPLNLHEASGWAGANSVYMQAAKIAAERLGITHPHEIQSIAWHMGRSLFDRPFKRSLKKDAIQNLWKMVDSGELTREKALQLSFELAGGIDSMDYLTGSTRNKSSHR
jgi:hypothetical protein